VIKYENAQDVKELAYQIISVLNDYFKHIDVERIHFIRSRYSRSRAYARIHALPRIWRTVLNLQPVYIIEVISENYDLLSWEEKVKTIIHELLHIPRRFTGGLRTHGLHVNEEIVNKLYRLYIERTRDYRVW